MGGVPVVTQLVQVKSVGLHSWVARQMAVISWIAAGSLQQACMFTMRWWHSI